MTISDFEMKHELALYALHALEQAWEEEAVKQYPKYLPSFDQFISDFSAMLEPIEHSFDATGKCVPECGGHACKECHLNHCTNNKELACKKEAEK